MHCCRPRVFNYHERSNVFQGCFHGAKKSVLPNRVIFLLEISSFGKIKIYSIFTLTLKNGIWSSWKGRRMKWPGTLARLLRVLSDLAV